MKNKQEGQMLLDWYGGMVNAYRDQLSEADRSELAAWEARNLGTLSTSDWPGSQRFLPRRPGSDLSLVREKRRA
jgi:hypothetical protein